MKSVCDAVPIDYAPVGAPVRAQRERIHVKEAILPAFSVYYTTSEQCAEEMLVKVRESLKTRTTPLFVYAGKTMRAEIGIHAIYINNVLAWQATP